MHLSNYKTEYLQNALKHLNKNNETYGEIVKELESRKSVDSEKALNAINELKAINSAYLSATKDIDVFLKHYKLPNHLNYAQLRPFIDLDKQKISETLKLYEKCIRQYIWENVSYHGVYEKTCKMLDDYDDFFNDNRKKLIALLDKPEASPAVDFESAHKAVMEKFNVDYDTAKKLYDSCKKYESDSNSITSEYTEGRLSESQLHEIQNDIFQDLSAVIDNTILNCHSKQHVDIWLSYLDYSHDAMQELFLKQNDIVLDNVDKQNLGLQEIIHNHMLKFRDAIVELKKVDNYVKGLEALTDKHKRIGESFNKEWQLLKDKQAENQKKSKEFLLNMMEDDEDNEDALAMLNRLRQKNVDSQSCEPSPVSQTDLKQVKASLDDCYDGLNVIMDKVHEVYESLNHVRAPSKESSLSDIILMLMNMNKEYIDNQYNKHSDLYNYLKLYKTIQLTVGRNRGITNAIHTLVKADDIIIVPENHHKQQYSQLPCVVINPNELHLIPDDAAIGNIYIDYYRTMFDSEIKSIYEALGKSNKQFFIMVG